MSYGYGSDGRVATTTNALGHVTRMSYNERGQMTRQWGDAVYPVEYTFNEHGEQQTMTTFRVTDGSFHGASWPGNAGGDTTTWVRKPHSPLLWKKVDAANQPVEYDYDNAGRLTSRIWARGATTTYRFAGDGTGDLTSATYSGAVATPSEFHLNDLSPWLLADKA